MSRILGISASLRNARFGTDNQQLLEELRRFISRDEMVAYLEEQTRVRAEDFVSSGRGEGKAFDEIYARLRRLSTDRGLSNSEAALAAALWAADQEGAEIDFISLAHFFPSSGKIRDPELLKTKLMRADGIILSGPVYFGDRGSLAQSLLEFIAADPELTADAAGKVYSGIAVGAKRNGGQETTLIYQMLDMVNLGYLAVGNSSETTSQYGGTALAGDVGTLYKDDYGISTCIGTGQRTARVASLLEQGRAGRKLKDRMKVQLWLVQDDKHGNGHRYFSRWMEKINAEHGDLELELMDMSADEITRCIACDICPISLGAKEEYRCIITTGEDLFVKRHRELVSADAVLLCAYSPEDKSNLMSVYQQFIERTRYLRRDNYALSDLLFAPFVVSELSARQNLHLRMMTSGVRHHTILHHPLIGMVKDGELINKDNLMATSHEFIRYAREVTLGRLLAGGQDDLLYNPIGYEVSGMKSRQDIESGEMARVVKDVAESVQEQKIRRVQ